MHSNKGFQEISPHTGTTGFHQRHRELMMITDRGDLGVGAEVPIVPATLGDQVSYMRRGGYPIQMRLWIIVSVV